MKNPAKGTFVLTPLEAGTLVRDSGTLKVVYDDPTPVLREGQQIYIYRNTYTLKGKQGSMSIRERNEWVDVSNENAPGFDFRPGVGIGTWKVVAGRARTPTSPEADEVATRAWVLDGSHVKRAS